MRLAMMKIESLWMASNSFQNSSAKMTGYLIVLLDRIQIDISSTCCIAIRWNVFVSSALCGGQVSQPLSMTTQCGAWLVSCVGQSSARNLIANLRAVAFVQIVPIS